MYKVEGFLSHLTEFYLVLLGFPSSRSVFMVGLGFNKVYLVLLFFSSFSLALFCSIPNFADLQLN